MSKIVVVGANHAGTAAVNTILGAKTGDSVKVFDKNSNISFLGCGMALWIGNQIRGSEGLFYSNKEKLEAAGAEVFMETDVYRIDFDGKKIFARTKDGHEMIEEFDKLILATGSIPIVPNIPGKDLENVQMVKLYQNAAEVIEKLHDPQIQEVTVVGAGYIGVELAEAFERHGKKVTMIDVADTVLASYYDPEFSEGMAQVLKNHNIRLVFGETVTQIKGDKKVEAIVTDKGEYKSDMVILSIGFRPNNALGKDQLELFRNGAYLVDKTQQTSVKDVYAIGDCATVYDNSIDDRNYIALATNAVRSGIIAASNVIGSHLETLGVQGSNGICIYDYKMVSTGLSVKKAKVIGKEIEYVDFCDLQKPEFIETENPEVKIRIVYDKKTRVVLGAQMASYYDMSMGIHMFSLAIQKKTTIDELKLLDIFFLPHFNKPYNYITMAALNAK